MKQTIKEAILRLNKIIEATPTGDDRNLLTEANIKLHQILQSLTPSAGESQEEYKESQDELWLEIAFIGNIASMKALSIMKNNFTITRKIN